MQRYPGFWYLIAPVGTVLERALLHAWKLPLDRGNTGRPTSRLVAKE